MVAILEGVGASSASAPVSYPAVILHRLPLREEPIGDAALIELLDGARVQTAGAQAVELPAGAPLDNRNVDPRQRQLARQPQPGRAPSGDHRRMSLRTERVH